MYGALSSWFGSFPPSFLIEIATNICRKRMRKHISQAAVLARWMKDFGINPPIL